MVLETKDQAEKGSFEVFLKEKLNLPVTHRGKKYESEDFRLKSPEPLVDEDLVELVNDYFAGSEFKIKAEVRNSCRISWSVEKNNLCEGFGTITNYSGTETKLVFVTIKYEMNKKE